MPTSVPMLSTSPYVRAFFLACPRSYPFSLTFSSQNHKVISRNMNRLSLASLSNTAFSYAYDELPEKGNGRSAIGIEFLHLMEEHGVCVNCQAYLWLLEGCLNSRSYLEGWKLQRKILKLGFYAEQVLCNRLIDMYIAFDDLDGAAKAFDDMPGKDISIGNQSATATLLQSSISPPPLSIRNYATATTLKPYPTVQGF